MLINMEPFGRLGNRLFLAAHVIAFGLKHNIPTMNLGFGEYADLFPWMDGNAAVAYPWRPTGNRKQAKGLTLKHQVNELMPWSNRYSYWGAENENYDQKDNPKLLVPLLKGRDVYLRTWLFRGFDSVARYRSEILEVFRPGRTVEDQVDTLMDALGQGADRLIGVHVRWEDYRGTEHYLDQQGFRSRMEEVALLWPGERVRFVLFSNESLPREGWGDLDFAVSPSESVVFDLYAMSRCHLLMAPPSTFSGWASFYGNRPLLTLMNHQKKLSRADFVWNR